MKESQLQVFLEGVQQYFQHVANEEISIGTPYLVENTIPAAQQYSGVIAISGYANGIVYFTSPEELAQRLLVLMDEYDTSEENVMDIIGEVANTIAGNARRIFGETLQISVPIVIRGAPDEIMLPRRDRSFVIPIKWKLHEAAIVIALQKPQK
ncbi:chemotaxis protein CheX [Neisseria sp. 83E34]|uniref:chemotaxis protein CheX n=1 Tax=Neisseria sp. 83E34 TaxID=1692264 RepID=UPI0006CE80BD|nr:chemotaxis protein CheX [Neisseria sp. 83E34]KPN71229.1 chemotaxis protein CheC [Neisseria sp. 83E34]